MDLDLRLRALAERQHGVITRAQARELGADRHHLRRRLESPAWEAATSKVIRLVGSQRTFRQRCMAAALDAGPKAVVSHQAAAALWRLPGFLPGALHVSRATGRSGRRSTLAVLHQSWLLPDTHLRLLESIPVTSPARTVFDLGGVLHPARTERTLDNALARGLTTVAGLAEVVTALAARGRGGSAVMRRLLVERDGSYVAPESGLEARFLAILREAGIPLPLPQRDVGGEAWIGRVDFLDPERRLIVEIDSRLHHTSLSDAAADVRRDEECRKAGYRVLRIDEHQVWHRPWEVVSQLRIAE